MAQQLTKQTRKAIYNLGRLAGTRARQQARATRPPLGTPAPKWSLEEQTYAALASVTVVTTLLEQAHRDDLPARVASAAATMLNRASAVLKSLNLPQVAMGLETKKG